MPRPRFFNLPPSTRSQLLALAVEEFAARGYEDASLNEILARAGISKGAYYYYFDDKEDLFATAMESALDETLARFPLPDFSDLTRDDFWPRVERALVVWSEQFDVSSAFFRAAVRFDREQRANPRFASLVAKAHAFWRTLIEAGQRVGCIRSDVANDVLLQLVEANDVALDAIFAAAHPEGRYTTGDVREHVSLLLDTFQRLLEVRAPPAPATRVAALSPSPSARRGAAAAERVAPPNPRRRRG